MHNELSNEFVLSVTQKYGSKDAAIIALGAQTYDLREERREIEEEIEALEKRVAPDGAVVLTGAKAESWKKIDAQAQELKLADDKIGDHFVTRAKKATELESDKAKSDATDRVKNVAKAAKMDPDVLAPLIDQFGLEVENREIQVQGNDGKLTPQQVAHVRKKGDANAAWEKLSDFAGREGSPLKPFSVALAEKGTTSTGTSTGTATPGVPFPAQSGGGPGTAGNGSAVDKFLEKRNAASARPNAFTKPTAEKKAG